MSNTPVPVAIVGMAALLPEAQDLAAYWRNIVDARDCLSDIPEDHSWSPKDFYDEDPSTPDKTWATRGGFIGKAPFDPIEHGVIPVALEAIDTDQLLALIVARECLRDAGLDPDGDGWNRDRTSVILGHTSTNQLVVDLSARLHGPTWRKAMQRQGVPQAVVDRVLEDVARFFPTWQEQSFPGMLANVSAGRIANRLDLGGTNATVDAACASSLGALHYAIAELQAGRTDIALSGGTDTLNDIFMYMCFSKTPALSRKGDARPFDVDADGIVISEGVAMFAMKRLEDAERDGDRIYAVIKGIGTSSDGRNKSIYAPASSGQVKAVRRAYDEAGFDIETVELIEAHGTGTTAGDLAEFNGLREVFAPSTRQGKHVAMGSVKSQIGHTKATAGAAGLMKAVLALHQRVLPPTAKITRPNPKMAFEGCPLYLNTAARPWVNGGATPRRAGVSAFGFGGTNYHVAVEEYVPGAATVMLPANRHLFLFAADSDEDLLTALSAAAQSDETSVPHASHAALSAFTNGTRVIAFQAESQQSLADALAAAQRLVKTGKPGKDAGVRYAQPTPDDANVGVVFPGQGSQYLGMGRTAALRHPTVRQALDRAERAMLDAGRGSLFSRIDPAPVYTDDAKAAQVAELTATEWAQPALGAVEVGLWSALRGFGVQASAFAGHSYGELVALHAGGAYDEDTLWTLSRVRGEAMKATPDQDRGTMAAIRGDLDAVAKIVDTLKDVVLANRNHPTQAIISGTRHGVSLALKALDDAGFSGMPIPVSAAFHSPLVADARQPLADALAHADITEPTVPVFSNAKATAYTADGVADGLADQIVSSVDWVGVVGAMVDSGVRTFIECGPKTVLSGLIKRCTKGVDGIEIVSIDDGGRTDGDTLLKAALATLACRGVQLDLSPLLAERLPPRTRGAGSLATVWVGGANVKRPETLNPPAPEAPLVFPTPTAARREEARVHADGSIDAPARRRAASPIPMTDTAGPPLFTAAPKNPGSSSKSPVRKADTQATATTGDALSSLLAATRDSLAAFQETQARTAEVHQRFLDGHVKAQEGFAELFRAHARLVEIASGGDVSALTKVARQTYTPPTVAANHEALTDAIVRPTAASTATTLNMPSNDGPPVASGVDLPPILSARALSDMVKAGTALPESTVRRSVAAPVQPVMHSVDVDALLLATVADKTGYPADLLNMDMDLESDLGVDSIKRVEILSAVQEALPGMAELPDDELASLRTLGDIAARLRTALEPAGTVAATPRPAAPEAPTLPPRKGSGSGDVHNIVMGVVADKTGYPVDLLGVAMDLESDLGIDSIKRVEIVSAVQDALPSLPDLDEEALASLRTLGQIIDHLVGVMGGQTVQASPAEALDIRATLMTVVAEKTGYPADLLDPSMALEGDLGIDSIKRVEILSALQEAIPGLPDLPEDDLAQARTLGEIADIAQAHRVDASAPTTAPKAAASVDAPTATRPGPIRREVVVVPAPHGVGVTLNGPVAITRDRLGLADDLAAALRELGVTATIIDPDYSTVETVAEALPPQTRSVVHMGALGAIEADLRARVRGAVLLAKATGPIDFFCTVSGLGGTFGIDELAGPPLHGAMSGLVKTLDQEWAKTRCVAIDILTQALDAARLAEELVTDRGVVEVGLMVDEPITLDAVEVSLNDAVEPTHPVQEGDLIVVTGGARGVTAAVAMEMARRWKPTLLLLGRSPVPGQDPEWAQNVADEALKPARIAQLRTEGAAFDPRRLEREIQDVRKAREIRSTLDQVDATGARAVYAAADVNDPEAVRAAIHGMTATAGPVRGVVHGAGVIADKLLIDKDISDIDWVFNTKVSGLDAVLAQVSISDLKLVGLFSSVAGRYGNRGQCDYAMANEAITHVGHALRHRGVAHVKAFHWGPWAGGMVTPTLAAAFRARGLDLVGIDTGAAAFCDEFERGGPEVEVVIGGPERAEALVGTAAPPTDARRTSGSETVHLSGEQTFLDDHRIDGKPVLPFVMALEFMAASAMRACPDLKFRGVRDVAVLKGVVLQDEGVDLTLTWEPTQSVGPADVSLAFQLVGAKNKLGLPTVHYRGTVDLAPSGAAGDRFSGSNGLGKNAYPYAVADAYSRFLFHGPGFQGIESIRGMSDHGIVGTLAASRPKRLGMHAPAWTTDPVTLDSALQLVGLWVREHRGASALPTFVERYTQVAPFRGNVDVHINFEPTTTSRGRFQADFVDETGRVMARLDGGQYASMAGLEDRYGTTK
ncbi:MAG: SDR family NAD(P)-dependent oxidoreductase [Myxococcota bacterium]